MLGKHFQIFADKSAHKAPARDISMCSAAPDTFVSCGFDCQINVYDTRKRSIVQRHTQPSPLSTVCMSACGTHCIVGNLKGELTSFDFRNMSAPLATKRVHDGAVVRVAFIPSTFGRLTPSHDDNVIADIEPNAPPSGEEALSFLKFVDQCRNKQLSDLDGLCTADDNAHNDSWGDLLRTRQQADNFSMLDSPSMRAGNVTGRGFRRPTLDGLDGLNGSPIMAPSPNSDLIATPKSMGKNESGRAESTPISFEEARTIEQHVPERKVSATRALRRRSSFTEEFNPSNMSTPLLRIEAPIRLKHKLHDVIEEESSAMSSKMGESRVECKENQQNNDQMPVAPVGARQPLPQSERVASLGTVQLSNGNVCMTEDEFVALIAHIGADVSEALSDVVAASNRQVTCKLDAAIEQIGELHQQFSYNKALERGRNFALYFKARMRLDSIERMYEQLLEYTPDQVEAELPRLRLQWSLFKAAQLRDMNNNA